ncbi:MAG: CoA-binding protein [Planctomycetota bacterium]|jgi:predicted CoA-binding protein
MRIMVIGASANREKFGNKAVRAYLRQEHEVFPVNPKAELIEGATAYPSVTEVPGPIDRATVYLPPEAALGVLDELAARGDVGEVWLNPGADSPEVIDRARELGLETIVACSILDIGERPDDL